MTDEVCFKSPTEGTSSLSPSGMVSRWQWVDEVYILDSSLISAMTCHRLRESLIVCIDSGCKPGVDRWEGARMGPQISPDDNPVTKCFPTIEVLKSLGDHAGLTSHWSSCDPVGRVGVGWKNFWPEIPTFSGASGDLRLNSDW